ncbi:MAG: DHH family phosphoesterase [Crenarchaeota archaeon]|nr:DHH family phosphoesterase [Thermoproteota archaeon]
MHSLKQSENKYLKFWEKLTTDRPELYVLIPHEKPDFDAIASSCILQKLLTTLMQIKSVIVMDSPTLETQYVLRELNIDLVWMNPGDFSTEGSYDVVLIDSSNPERFISEQIKQLIGASRRIFAIDHHFTGESASATLELLYHPVPATTEIILGLSEELGVLSNILEDERLTKLAILGLVTDTYFFTLATPSTFRYMSKLSERVQYIKIVETLRKKREQPLPEKLARLKAMQRIMLRVINSKIVCITHVGSYESKVASSLLDMGADLSIVISPKRERGKKLIRVILRSKGIQLEPIVKEIADVYGASYGILMNYAGGIQISSKERIDKLRKAIMEIVFKHLGEGVET